jgi:hypothetical protein
LLPLSLYCDTCRNKPFSETFFPLKFFVLAKYAIIPIIYKTREGKMYRTPQSINALITFFSLFGPSLYAPKFAQIGYELGSVYFGVAYAAIVSLSVTALYESVRLMENPFVCHASIDGIDVYEELSIVCYLQLLRARSTIFPNAPNFGTSTPQLPPSLQRRKDYDRNGLNSRRSSRFSSLTSSSSLLDGIHETSV